MRILVMGLSGAGKTTLATELNKALIGSRLLNADVLREQFNDWDFSYTGRLRQAARMTRIATHSRDKFIIADFIAPLAVQREMFGADVTIWMDTVQSCQYEDTNSMFEPPTSWTMRITDHHKGNVLTALSIIEGINGRV